MGYDIITHVADAAKAEAFAKQYGYDYMFDEATGKYNGDASPYFRANIWGMGIIRDAMWALFVSKYGTGNENEVNRMDNILTKFSWNDGNHVTVQDCQFLIDLWNKDAAIDHFVMGIHTEIEKDPEALKRTRLEDGKLVHYNATVDEVVESDVKLLEEFIAYLGIAKELDGCHVW